MTEPQFAHTVEGARSRALRGFDLMTTAYRLHERGRSQRETAVIDLIDLGYRRRVVADLLRQWALEAGYDESELEGLGVSLGNVHAIISGYRRAHALQAMMDDDSPTSGAEREDA